MGKTYLLIYVMHSFPTLKLRASNLGRSSGTRKLGTPLPKGRGESLMLIVGAMGLLSFPAK
jgi:hypothetical protein